MMNMIKDRLFRKSSACRPDHRYLLIYDGQCAFCRNLAAMVTRLDIRGRVLLLDYHTQLDRVFIRAPGLDPEALQQAVHLVSPRGKVSVGFKAVRKLATVVPVLWPMLPALYGPGSSRVGPIIYDWISRNRHRLFECQPGAGCPLHAKPTESG